jgi:tRNA pseudouridine55 synthase
MESCELLPVETAVRSLTSVVVDAETAALVANGRVLPAWSGQGPWAIHAQMAGDPHTELAPLIAVYEAFGQGEAKPAVVLPTAAAR